MKLMGAACVILREANALRNGVLLWKAALYFRSQINGTKIILKQTSFENLPLNQTEIQCVIEIGDHVQHVFEKFENRQDVPKKENTNPFVPSLT